MLTKAGLPDVEFELHRAGRSEFEMIENGRFVRKFFRTMELRETWEKCISTSYPGYQVSNLEEWVRE